MTDFYKQPIPEAIKNVVNRILTDIPAEPTPGIYLITNEITKQVYVGSSKHIYSRLTTHFKMLHAKKHHSYKLQNSFNAHGIGAFSVKILEVVHEPDQLFVREQHYIDTLGSKRGVLLNVSKTADPSHYLKKKRRTRKKKDDNGKKKTTQRRKYRSVGTALQS